MKKLKTRAEKGKSEAAIEGAVARYATEQGIRNRKYNTANFAGALDRIFMPGNGVVFWIEFKREKGGKLSELQRKEIEWLQANGYAAFIVSDIQQGKDIVDSYVALL